MVDAEEMQDLVQIQSSKGLGERISGPKAMISSIQVASVMAVDIWGTWFILHNGVPSDDSLLKRTFQGGQFSQNPAVQISVTFGKFA